MQHQYVVTSPLEALAGRLVPNLREPDMLFYLRQREQSLVIGGYERKARPFHVDDIPDNSNPTIQPFDSGQFESILRGAAERIPPVMASGFLQQVNGLEAFTPDGVFLLGPAPRIHGLWVACGFCAHGVSAGGGVGKVIAEWIVNGDPGLDIQHMSLGRFGDTPPTRQAIQAGASKVYSTYYDLTH
jgi:4-methylaminobutanoate oxidase (formaldehyde-forming)